MYFLFLMIRRPPRSTRTDTLSLNDSLPIYRQHDLARGHDVFGLNLRCPLLTRQFAKRPDAFCKGSAQTRFMRAAVRCRNGVAVPAIAAVGPEWPGDGPFHSSRAIGEILSSVEEIGGGAFTRADLFAQMVRDRKSTSLNSSP